MAAAGRIKLVAMPHTEDRLERMVRETLIYEGTNKICRRVLATEIVVEQGPLSLAAVV